MAVSNMGRRRTSAIDVVCGMTKREKIALPAFPDECYYLRQIYKYLS